jgi:DNA-binding transcriptional regulator YdaS (Cro superfamily)
MDPIQRAAEILGSHTALADLCGVSKGAVSQWKDKARRVPAEYCPLIERATRERGSPVLCEELRPDMAWDVLRMQAGECPGHCQDKEAGAPNSEV